MKRLYFLGTLVLVMMVAVLPQKTKAQNPVWDGTRAPWVPASGTESDPYLIESSQNLAWLAKMVNDSAYTFNGKYFRLTTDLDMDNLDWTPIGNSTTNRFKGNFDGDGHSIENLYIHIPTYTNASGIPVNVTYAGMFGVIDHATIANLSVNSTINGEYPTYAGGIVAYSCGSSNSIVNCSHSGNISFGEIAIQSEGFRGGIIGYINGETTLSNCHNQGLVYDYHDGVLSGNGFIGTVCHLGGVVGGINTTASLVNCSNSGAIQGRHGRYTSSSYESYSGGLIGCVENGNISIIKSSNNGNVTGWHCGGLVGSSIYLNGVSGNSYGTINISNSYNTGTISEGDDQGGLVGLTKDCTITNCYNTGTLIDGYLQGGLIGHSDGSVSLSYCSNIGIQSTNTTYLYLSNLHYCGGIIGLCEGTTNISCCANRGNVIVNANATLDNSAAYCGGIVGWAINNLSLELCYNTAVVSGVGTSTNPYRYVGGLVGYLSVSANNIHECYNTGAVSTGTNGANNRCGGIVGNTQGGTSIINCYNTGALSGPNNHVSSIAYGTATITNCYYLNTCGGSSQTGAEPKASAYMKSPNFLYNLNVGVQAFTVDGNPNVNQGYPIFGDMVYTVSTQNASNVDVTRATLNGNYVGGADTVGFQYKENTTGNTWSTVYASIGSPVSYLLTGLQSNTNYVFRFMVLKNGGVYYGEEKTFTTGTCNLTASVSPSLVTLCQGEVATVTATGQSSLGNQYSYSWNTGETTPTISVIGGGERVVTVSDSNGCTATASVNVTVHPLPTVAISGNTTLCAGASSTLTASGSSVYAWNTGATTPSIAVSQGGTYSVTATNSFGCSSSASVSVVSIENVAISGNLNLCQGQSTTLYANGTGTYQWSTGASTPSITVQQAGPYSVTVSGGGCTSSASVTVSVAANPTPTILGNTTICQNQTTTLTANGGVSYSWNNGSSGSNITVVQSGTYSVTATSLEGCTGNTSIYVTVNLLPNVNINGNNSFCQGDNITLTATGANSYAWSNASTDAAITVSSAGNYTVTGTDANGCSNTATKTVYVNPTYNTPLTHSICEGESYNFYGQNLTTAGAYTHTLQTINGCDSVLTLTLTVKALPTPSISGNTALCEGESTTLTANGGISYNWSNGSATNSINVTESGIYTVTATNVEGCTATVNAIVTVNPLPIVVIGGNTSICEGGSTTLTASGADTYSWSTGDNTASATISAFGIYNVTGTSAAGCSSVASVTVLVSQLPVITITGETDICAGESTTLTANGGTTYLWSNGTTDATLTVSNAGTYQVIGYNEAGCNAMASSAVNVWQPATSEFSIECPDSCYIWNDQSYCTSGDYTQTFQTVHGCDSIVTLHLTITVGIDNHDLAASMTAYPNPTTGVVNVQCTMNNVQEGTMEIRLYDAYGKLVNVVSSNNDETAQIDLSRFAPGVYFVKAVADGNIVAVRKIVKR